LACSVPLGTCNMMGFGHKTWQGEKEKRAKEKLKWKICTGILVLIALTTMDITP
jgi:hypothetical protein